MDKANETLAEKQVEEMADKLDAMLMLLIHFVDSQLLLEGGGHNQVSSSFWKRILQPSLGRKILLTQLQIPIYSTK